MIIVIMHIITIISASGKHDFFAREPSLSGKLSVARIRRTGTFPSHTVNPQTQNPQTKNLRA